MSKRGSKPKGKVRIKWSPAFAYAIGLLVTDGNLSPNGRVINFTSKDRALVLTFLRALGIRNHVGRKGRANDGEKKYFVTQIGDVLFYRFLQSIGLTPNKTKTIGRIKIPRRYFFHFLRGHFDGDGCTYSYYDPRWRTSFLFYTCFVSASRSHLDWLRDSIRRHLGINGHVTGTGRFGTVYQVKYGKRESMKLLRKMYPPWDVPHLKRKRLKIEKALRIIGKSL